MPFLAKAIWVIWIWSREDRFLCVLSDDWNDLKNKRSNQNTNAVIFFGRKVVILSNQLGDFYPFFHDKTHSHDILDLNAIFRWALAKDFHIIIWWICKVRRSLGKMKIPSFVPKYFGKNKTPLLFPHSVAPLLAWKSPNLEINISTLSSKVHHYWIIHTYI